MKLRKCARNSSGGLVVACKNLRYKSLAQIGKHEKFAEPREILCFLLPGSRRRILKMVEVDERHSSA